MREPSTRFVAFGGSRIRIEHIGDRAREIVEFLYRDARDREEPSLQATFRVEDDPVGHSVTIHRSADVCYRGESLADAARTLQVNRTGNVGDRIR